MKGNEHKAFIPFDHFFHAEGVAPEKGKVVRARVDQLLKGTAMLDREVDGKREIPYEYAVVATGTQLPPPGTLNVEGEYLSSSITYSTSDSVNREIGRRRVL